LDAFPTEFEVIHQFRGSLGKHNFYIIVLLRYFVNSESW
jgi:hypothetical protein